MNEIDVSGGDSASADREIFEEIRDAENQQTEEIRDAENQQTSKQSNDESDEHADYAVSKLPGRKKKKKRRG